MSELLHVFKALGDPTRLRLLSILQEGTFNVNELVGVIEMGQSRVSRHLKILSDAGLVIPRREGSWVYYSLASGWSATGGWLPELSTELSIDAADRGRVDRCLRERRSRSESFFRGVAESWDVERDALVGPPDYLGRLVSEAGQGHALSVDLGTGTGLLLRELSAISDRVIGIDASREMLDVAGENTRDVGGIDLRLGALEHLPLADAQADLAVAHMVLHHVAHPPQALGEIHRILKPGGRLLLADFRNHDREVYRERLGDLWLGFSEDQLSDWLQSADLVVEDRFELSEEPERPAMFLWLA
ncbi:MAG: metalloregulator ArsR/SmtB family transcription factor, partial [Planctomycetota bacterium]